MKRIHGEKKPHKSSICDYASAQKRHKKENVNSVHEERSSLKSDLQNGEKENTSPGKALQVKKNQVVETNKRQKLIKNAIEKHGRQTGNEKLEKETKKITLNARGKPSSQSIRRNYVKVINIFIS
jgi:hypothetical protein